MARKTAHPELSTWLPAEVSVSSWRASRLYAGEPPVYWDEARLAADKAFAERAGLKGDDDDE